MNSYEDNIDPNLPFFPKHDSELLYKDFLRVTWFEPEFSQSRYNYNNESSGSNACTLIAILVATQCYMDQIMMSGPEESVNYFLIRALAIAMLEGNKLYESLKTKGLLTNINLTVPEAIKYTGKKFGLSEWKSVLYVEPLETSLFEHLKTHWVEWVHSSLRKHNPALYVVLICDSRSVLLIIHDNYDTVTLVDSHQHTQLRGALIAVVNRSRLKYLCNWFGDILQECYQSTPEMYELSFLYFRSKKK